MKKYIRFLGQHPNRSRCTGDEVVVWLISNTLLTGEALLSLMMLLSLAVEITYIYTKKEIVDKIQYRINMSKLQKNE